MSDNRSPLDCIMTKLPASRSGLSPGVGNIGLHVVIPDQAPIPALWPLRGPTDSLALSHRVFQHPPSKTPEIRVSGACWLDTPRRIGGQHVGAAPGVPFHFIMMQLPHPEHHVPGEPGVTIARPGSSSCHIPLAQSPVSR